MHSILHHAAFRCSLGLLLSAASWPASQAHAQCDSGWTQIPSAAIEPTRVSAAIAYSQSSDEVVLFGGLADSQALGDTWVYNAGAWTKATPAHAPSPRAFTAACGDSTRQRMVVHGGHCGVTTTLAGILSNATWAWNGTDWQQISSSGPAVERAAMAYDPVRDRSLLVGGTGPSGLLVNSYEFDHATSTWAALTISGTRPAPRTLASIVFDPSRDVFFLFGGLDAAGAPLADTWEYDPKRALNVRWRSIAATGPAARSQAGFVFDSVRNVALLHGGRVSGGNTAELWSFNGTSWSLVSSDGPLARSGHAAVALQGGSFLMVTGDCYSIANACSTETWIWRGPVASGDLAVGAVTGSGFGVAGGDINLSVAATSSGPLSYQWRRFGVALADSSRISGATGPALQIRNITPADFGDYDVVVRDGCRVSSSSTARRVGVACPTRADLTGTNLPARYASLSTLTLTQTLPTLGGNNQNELNQLFLYAEPRALRIAATGNFGVGENFGHGLVLAFDTRAGGSAQIPLDSYIPEPKLPATLQKMTFDAAFTPDYLYSLNVARVLPDTVARVWVDRFEFGPGASWRKRYSGSRFIAGAQTASFISYDNPFCLNCFVNNSNTVGVTAADASDATSATTGLEVSIPLEDIGMTSPCATFRVSAFLVRSTTGVLNQFLPPLPIGSVNLGYAPDLQATAGDQFATVTIPGSPTAITSAPAARSIPAGASVVLEVQATGSAPLAFAWLRQGRPLTETLGRIEGVGTNQLRILNAVASDSGLYSVIVSGPCGVLTSDPAALGIRPCPADLNSDNQVDDADFVIFAAAYNTLDCADPVMAAGCPADLNIDGFVDDADFVTFATAYNELVCP
ncbi:MAG: hypothetical protein K2Y21_08990 [Phycisphaerales bacterium]|nr:hypothetical protein [Phycisphaerales bacterium]